MSEFAADEDLTTVNRNHCGNAWLNGEESSTREIPSVVHVTPPYAFADCCMQVDRVDRGHLLRSLATTTLLEYHAPSFTYGTDLILPSETNFNLRQVILERTKAAASEDEGLAGKIKNMNDLDAIRAFIHSSIDAQGLRRYLYIPEVSDDMK